VSVISRPHPFEVQLLNVAAIRCDHSLLVYPGNDFIESGEVFPLLGLNLFPLSIKHYLIITYDLPRLLYKSEPKTVLAKKSQLRVDDTRLPSQVAATLWQS
jgi:hypothetical protein